jgi:hypothetical protein
MTLNYPRGAFAQSIRMRRRSLPHQKVLLIVEGSTDKSAYSSFVSTDVHFVAGRGKETVLNAYDDLASDNLDNCIFVVDCDGNTDARWLGLPDLFISENRDIEADLILGLRAFERVAIGHLLRTVDDVEQAKLMAHTLVQQAASMTSVFGIVFDAARALGLPLRVRDASTGQKRRIRPDDVDLHAQWISSRTTPPIDEVANAIGIALGWEQGAAQHVTESATSGGTKPCREHSVPSCSTCIHRRFSNGHSLTRACSQLLSAELSYAVSPEEVGRSILVSPDTTMVSTWSTAARIKRWQSKHGVTAVA